MMMNQKKNGLEVSRELGIDNPVSVYLWRKAYLEGGIDALTPKGRTRRPKAKLKASVSPEVIEKLVVKNEELEQEIDLLRSAIEVLQEKSGVTTGVSKSE
jgi:transposase-like protein